MAVNVGGLVEDTDFNNAVNRVNAVLGNGDGQSGYGQIVPSAEDYRISADDELIDHTHWNALIADINRCANHSQGADEIAVTLDTGDIVGANASGISASNLDATSSGINDILSGLSSIESSATTIAAGQFDLTTGRQFETSTRFSPWGGDGDVDDSINCEIDVIFKGGYPTTNAAKNRISATGADHRRHFFNAGGEIHISFTGTDFTDKDSNWLTMFTTLGTVKFRKNDTTVTGTGLARDGVTDLDGGGIDSAVGNFQVNTGDTYIFTKSGSLAYSNNKIEIYVTLISEPNEGWETLRFKIYFHDYAEGNPNFDERVLVSGGNQIAGIDLKRANDDDDGVNIPIPDAAVNVDFENT